MRKHTDGHVDGQAAIQTHGRAGALVISVRMKHSGSHRCHVEAGCWTGRRIRQSSGQRRCSFFFQVCDIAMNMSNGNGRDSPDNRISVSYEK